MTSVIPEQIKHFNDFAADWWNLTGSFKGLHQMTPARMAFVLGQIPDLKGLSVLDVGCGGGLMAEPIARLGGFVTGIDAGEQAILAAKTHANSQNLSIDYRCETLEMHHGTYDLVLAMDILEHVENPALFIATLASKVKPGGRLIVSTLNRTWKSYVFGIIVAENIVGLAPKGSHQWQKFIEPAHLSSMCRNAHLEVSNIQGFLFNPLTQSFTLSPTRLGINYALCATAQSKTT